MTDPRPSNKNLINVNKYVDYIEDRLVETDYTLLRDVNDKLKTTTKPITYIEYYNTTNNTRYDILKQAFSLRSVKCACYRKHNPLFILNIGYAVYTIVLKEEDLHKINILLSHINIFIDLSITTINCHRIAVQYIYIPKNIDDVIMISPLNAIRFDQLKIGKPKTQYTKYYIIIYSHGNLTINQRYSDKHLINCQHSIPGCKDCIINHPIYSVIDMIGKNQLPHELIHFISSFILIDSTY